MTDATPPGSEGDSGKGLLAYLLTHHKEISELAKGIAEAYVTVQREENWKAFMVGFLLAGIIIAASVLAFARILDPASFGFVVGPIVGGLVTYLVNATSKNISIG